MTSKTTTLIQEAGKLKRFREYPPRDDMQNWRYIYDPGLPHSLGIHLRKTFPHSTVMCEVPLARSLSRRDRVRIPDMSVTLDGDRALIEEQSGYEIDMHGKALDFALEVASPTTGVVDYTDKRRDYERFGVREYWRFDPSGGRFHDAPLAGDKLVDGGYRAIEIVEEPDGRRWGYSEALGLELWWDDGMLRLREPETGEFLRTPDEIYVEYQAAESRVDTAESRVADAESRAVEAEARAATERAARESAEARLAEMEAEMRRLRGE